MKSTALVLVHGDFWGLLNANKIVRAALANGYHVKLAVSRKAMDENGRYKMDRLPELQRAEIMKEKDCNDLLSIVDGYPSGKKGELLSFKALNKLAGNSNKNLRYIPVGSLGGKAVQALVEEFNPDIIFSGDTLALLKDTTVNKIPCYGVHPGPLPLVPGLHATARQVINDRFENINGGKYVVGSLFKLSEKLDDGEVIAQSAIPYREGDSLFAVRANLYDSLTDVMAQAMPGLRDGIIKGHRQDTSIKGLESLTSEALKSWLKKPGNQLYNKSDIIRILDNLLPKGLVLPDSWFPKETNSNDLLEYRQRKNASSGRLEKYKRNPDETGWTRL